MKKLLNKSYNNNKSSSKYYDFLCNTQEAN